MFKQLRNHIKRLLHKPKVESGLTVCAIMDMYDSKCKTVGLITCKYMAEEYAEVLKGDVSVILNPYLPHHATDNAEQNRN